MILTSYNGKSDIVVFWHKYNLENTSTNENKKCGNHYRDKILSKTF